MARRMFRVIETTRDVGNILKGLEKISKAAYKVEIKQGYLISESGEQEQPGLRRIEGDIFVLSGEKFLTGRGELTLHLQDGRQWKFLASHGNPIKGEFKVINGSGSLEPLA